MPAISGSQKAVMYARAAKARAGATRNDYYQPMLYITIGGTAAQARMDIDTLVIEQALGEQPDSASLQVITKLPSTFLPVKGQEIIIGLGAIDNRIFAGHVSSTDLDIEDVATARPRMTLNCTDYTWELGHKRCRGRQWTMQSASLIANELVTEWAPGFTCFPEFGLTGVDFSVSHQETLPSALSRLAEMVGAKWFVDYRRGVRFYRADPITGNLITIGNGQADIWGFKYKDDISQIRTRVFSTGASTSTTADVAISATTIPVDDVRFFSETGGRALLGLNEITYTGLSVTAGPGSLTGVPDSGDWSVRYAVANGAPVTVLALEEDSGAQSAVASLLGSGHNGVIDHVLNHDGRWDGEAHAAAAGDLDSYAVSSEQILGYSTRSKFATAGRAITLTLTSPLTVSASLVIQRVRISDFTIGQRNSTTPTKFPIRQVSAGKSTTDLVDIIAGAL